MVVFLKQAWAFVVRYRAEIILVAIAVRQFIIGDWFAGFVLMAAAAVVFVGGVLRGGAQ